eukprot:g82830.t1
MACMLRLLLVPLPGARTVPVVALLVGWTTAHLCVLLLSRAPGSHACPRYRTVAGACVLALIWQVRAELHARSPTGLLGFGRKHNAEKLSCAGLALLSVHVGAVAFALYKSAWPVQATTAAYQALNLNRLNRDQRWMARQARGGLHNVPLRVRPPGGVRPRAGEAHAAVAVLRPGPVRAVCACVGHARDDFLQRPARVTAGYYQQPARFFRAVAVRPSTAHLPRGPRGSRQAQAGAARRELQRPPVDLDGLRFPPVALLNTMVLEVFNRKHNPTHRYRCVRATSRLSIQAGRRQIVFLGQKLGKQKQRAICPKILMSMCSLGLGALKLKSQVP